MRPRRCEWLCSAVSLAHDSHAASYVSLLRGCRSDKTLEVALDMLEEMKHHEVPISSVHHNMVLDACVVSGRLDLAFAHFVEMLHHGVANHTYNGVS